MSPVAREGLTRLRDISTAPTGGALRSRYATQTHELRDLSSLFSGHAPAPGGGKRVRVCFVDTVLQTGGAEWFAAQVATAANPDVFDVVYVTYNATNSALPAYLRQRGIDVISATTSNAAALTFAEWRDEQLFELLERVRPDVLFFSSQYLFEQLPSDRLSRFPAVVRISNFHPERLRSMDMSPADKIVCCSDEQYAVVDADHGGRATLIRTAVDTELFRPLPSAAKDALKQQHGLSGKRVVLFVARLGDPLKRTPLFQEVVRELRRRRDDVAVVVVGYFESHNSAGEEAFREFATSYGVVWKERVVPWEMPEYFRLADVLLSTSDTHEGLSNTVLQALAAGVVPVVTASSGMHEIIEPGVTGFIVHDNAATAIADHVVSALDVQPTTAGQWAEDGRRSVQKHFDLSAAVVEYQRTFLEVHRRQPVRVAITDGYFGTGGAEWLAAMLMLNSNASQTAFHLVVHRRGAALLEWVAQRGIAVHESPPGMTFTDWRRSGMEDAFRRLRPDIVMPCTITTWPTHDLFYRLLIISQNASDASVLTDAQYDEADYFLCVSEEVRAQLSPAHRWKMSVLRNSIDVDMFREDPDARSRMRQELDIRDATRAVLWCGRMHEPRKRLDVLIDVMHEMRSDSGVHFIVLGYFRGDEGDQTAWSRFLESHSNVSWVQDRPPWEVPAYYAAADVYLSTSGFKESDFEGLSVATVQALATSLPVVTTKSGGQQEVVEEGVNGRLVPPGDVEGLVSALRATLSASPEELGEMKQRNRQRALERFDIRRHAETYGRIASVLRNTVGAALAVEPQLETPPYRFMDASDTSDSARREAASFLAYTWPLLRMPRESGGDGADMARLLHSLDAEQSPAALISARGVSNATRDRAVMHAADATELAASLVESTRLLTSGGWLIVTSLGWASSRDDVDTVYSAKGISAVLRFLDKTFPLWGRCERYAGHLLLQKR